MSPVGTAVYHHVYDGRTILCLRVVFGCLMFWVWFRYIYFFNLYYYHGLLCVLLGVALDECDSLYMYVFCFMT